MTQRSWRLSESRARVRRDHRRDRRLDCISALVHMTHCALDSSCRAWRAQTHKLTNSSPSCERLNRPEFAFHLNFQACDRTSGPLPLGTASGWAVDFIRSRMAPRSLLGAWPHDLEAWFGPMTYSPDTLLTIGLFERSPIAENGHN